MRLFGDLTKVGELVRVHHVEPPRVAHSTKSKFHALGLGGMAKMRYPFIYDQMP